MKRNITKQLLRVHGSVRDSDSIRAGTARGANSETRAFDAISISIVQKRGLFLVTAQALLRQGSNVSTMQRYKGNVGCCLFQNTRIRDLQ